MHKRQKREYGIFHSFFKKSHKLELFILFSIFVLLFFISCHKSYALSKKIIRLSKYSYLNKDGKCYDNNNSNGNLAIHASTVNNLITGFIYEDYGRYQHSLKYIKNCLKKSRTALGYYYLSKIYFKNKKYNSSMLYLNKALKISSKKSKINYLILKAKIYAEENKLEKSINTLESILKQDPSNKSALFLIANLYKYKKDFAAAIDFFNLIKTYYPTDINAYYELSRLYIMENKPEKAEKNLKQVLKINPYFKNGYFELAVLYEITGKEKKAIKVFQNYIHYNPYSKKALYQLGIINYAIKKYSLSRKYLLRLSHVASAKEINSRNGAYFFIGLSYYFQHDYLKSIKYLSMLKYGNHYVNAKLQEIEIYLILYRKNKKPEFITKVNNIINEILKNKKLKKNLKVYYFSAIFLSSIKRFNKAKSVILKELKYFPNNTPLLYELGSAYHSLKENKKSMKIMEKIIKINPLDSNALNFIGYFLAVQGQDLARAKTLIKKALSINHDSPYIMDSMGFVYFKYKQYKKALPYFISALKKLKDSRVVMKHAGMDYFMLKDYKKALMYFKSLEKIKKSKAVKDYIQKISKHLKTYR